MWQPLLGLAIGAGLLAILFATSNIGDVVHDFGRFERGWLPEIGVLLAARAGVRAIEWRFLLRALGLSTGWRHAALGLLAADACQIIPGGLLAGNLVLKRLDGASVASSLPATWGMQLLEATLSLLVLIVLGVPGWWWIRPAAVVVGLGLAGFLAALLWGRAHVEQAVAGGPRLAAWLGRKAQRFLSGIERLLTPATLARALALTACYLVLTFASFSFIVRGLGVSNVGWLQSTVVYAFTLAIVNLNPLPTDLGISEGSGVSIFLANGVPEADGLTAMLIIRLAIVGSAAILACLAAAASPGEVAALWRGPSNAARPCC